MLPKFVLSAALMASTPAAAHAQTMIASWYGPHFHGHPTASGCIYNQHALTAASRDLPLGSLIAVSRQGRRVILLVNDRGPFVSGRRLDLSHAAAQRLDMLRVGVAEVQVRVIGWQPPCPQA